MKLHFQSSSILLLKAWIHIIQKRNWSEKISAPSCNSVVHKGWPYLSRLSVQVPLAVLCKNCSLSSTEFASMKCAHNNQQQQSGPMGSGKFQSHWQATPWNSMHSTTKLHKVSPWCRGSRAKWARAHVSELRAPETMEPPLNEEVCWLEIPPTY